MSNRTIIALALAAFGLGFGAVTAYKIPPDSLLMAVTMVVTALIIIGAVSILGWLAGWVVVNVERARHPEGRQHQAGYPPVMIFPSAQAPPGLPGGQPNSYGLPPEAPRRFTIIGGDAAGDDDVL